MAKSEFESLIDRYNLGEPIPEVNPADLRAALLLFSDIRSLTRHGRLEGSMQAPGPLGFLLEDLARRCSPNAAIFAVALRGVLLDIALPLARKKTERPDVAGLDKDDFIIQAIAKMPLVAAQLRDPDAIVRRIDNMANSEDRNSMS